MYKLIHRLFSSTKLSGVAKILAPASLVGLAALSVGLIVSHTSQTAFATTSSTVTFNITDAVSIRLVDKTDTDVITSLDMSLIVTPKGTFVSDWFNAEISTSNATGYTLYMTSDYQSDGSTYTTDLINSDDATFTIPTLAANVSKTDFSTPGGSYLNRWGYSLDDTTYSPVPAHTTSATLKTTSTEINKDLVPIHVGVMADMNKASGLYKNSLVFTAIPNPIPTDYSLYFQPGTTDTVTNLPATMTSSEVAAQHTFTIPATAPSRTGYNFTGYLDESTSTTYQAGDSITVVGDIDYTGSATLTAQWEQADPWSTITTMQGMTTALCDAADIDATKTLTDTRDNNTYTVRKLKDNKCWMTQNLKLTGERALTPSDSNISSNWTLPAVNETFPDAFSSCEDAAYNMKSSTDVSTYASYGNYYNWYAATAGTGTCAMTSGNATASICPKGWRLPTSGEFEALAIQYDYSIMGDPAFVLSGYRFGSYNVQQDEYGQYWSSKAYSSDSNLADSLRFDRFGVDPMAVTSAGRKNFGLTVRCVAQ